MAILKEKKEEGWGIGHTLLDGLDLGAAATGGVDGFIVLLGGRVRRLLPDHNRLPILANRTDSGHSDRVVFAMKLQGVLRV